MFNCSCKETQQPWQKFEHIPDAEQDWDALSEKSLIVAVLEAKTNILKAVIDNQKELGMDEGKGVIISTCTCYVHNDCVCVLIPYSNITKL